MAKKMDPLVFSAVVVGVVGAALFAYTRLRPPGPSTRINVPRGASIVNGEYISGVVDPYTGRYITGTDMGNIDWGV